MNDMTALVSPQTIASIIFSMIVTLLGPILFLAVWRIKTKCNLLPALAGALTFIVAALVLESIPKYFLLSGGNPVSDYILTHAFAYGIVGALLAGIFEECGRYVAFRFLLKNHRKRETAITYGIGHGGIECCLIVGMTMVSNLILAVMINNGSLALIMANLPAEQAGIYDSVVESLTTTGFGIFLAGIWERIFAMLLHLSLSVLVFTASKNKSKLYLFPLAVILHALLDFPAAFYQFGILPLAAVEVLIAIISTGCALFAYHIYRDTSE